MTTSFSIQNGDVVLPDRTIRQGTVILEGTRILHAGRRKKTPRASTEIDARGGFVTPGLIDIHIHGAGPVGWETCAEEQFRQLESILLSHGVLRFVPTMMADETVIRRVAHLYETVSSKERMPGIYLEGPFISVNKRGGVQKKYVRPVDLPYLKTLQQISGHRIRMMTFAPELEGACQLPLAMRELGILPCVGHSLATGTEAAAACGKLKTNCTHLFNAMTGLDHREPGIAAFAMNRDSVFVELNPDGTHVAPDLMQITWKAKRHDRIILISDAVVSAGGKPGTFEYMNREIESTAKGVYYKESGTLVGSSILLNQGVARFMKFTGAAVHEAVRLASLNPATLLGLARRTGSLEAGKRADVVVFSRRFDRVRAAFWNGSRLGTGVK